MEPRTESRILRLAIARGLLQWEDLDAVADRVPESGEPGVGGERWLEALVAAGRLDPEVVRALATEVGQESGDDTPDLAQNHWPVPAERRRRTTRQASPPPGPAPRFPPELAFLASWERYRVERLLGSGGMGTVYKAFDPTLGRTVALKFLHRNDALHTERFLREARSQARINHPNICPVHEVGEAEGRPYIAMRYVEGRSLADVREELSVESLLRLVQEVALAVHAAHRTGLIHRDLKPGNVLVETTEAGDLHPFVVDFGLAQDQEEEEGLTRTGMITGTPAYLSPEQAQGLPVDRRSDVYSLGVMLYELLAGRTPFAAPNPAALLVQLVQEEPKPLRALSPSVPADLETIVMKCLEKDPGRRYDSARALADDLERYLEGEPIQARPAGWVYRAGKKVRKHKALTVVTVAAVLALLIQGGASLRAQWVAAERAELAQVFGRRVRDLEATLRYEALLPLHDTTPRKAEIRRELAEIRAEMKRLGAQAEGPGNYALGRAYLALHEHEQALDHLERAVRAGERGPEVAAALGQVLGTLYEKALIDTNRDPTRDVAETFRQPALAYLKEAAVEARDAPYLAALIAYYESRYPEAVAKAREAYQREPWFYEAGRLEAEIHAAQGDAATEAGQYEQAVRHYDQAGEVYRRLLGVARSDAALHAADCEWRIRRIEAQQSISGFPEDQVQGALAACDLALQVDRGLGQALTHKARLFRRRGEWLSQGGEDPRPDLTAAVTLSRQAIALNPRDGSAYNHASIALRTQATWERRRGMDSMGTSQQALEAASRGVELQPRLAASHNNLGNAWLELAQARQERGLDPREALEKGIASLDQATRLNRRFHRAYSNLGTAWKIMAEAQLARGEDPTRSLENGAGALEQAVRLNPNYVFSHNNLGNTYLTLAEYQRDSGGDPRPSLLQAARSYQRAIAIKPDYPLPPFNLGYTERTLAQELLRRGDDPTPALERAESYLDAAYRLNPTDADVFLERARVHLTAGLWARRQNQDPDPLFREAEAALRQAATMNPEQPDVPLTQALLERYRAERDLGRGGRPLRAIQAGLDQVTQALAIRPGEALYLAEQGVLLTQAARLETDPARRREQARQAAASLRKSLETNPLLRREYREALAEAERLEKAP